MMDLYDIDFLEGVEGTTTMASDETSVPFPSSLLIRLGGGSSNHHLHRQLVNHGKGSNLQSGNESAAASNDKLQIPSFPMLLATVVIFFIFLCSSRYQRNQIRTLQAEAEAAQAAQAAATRQEQQQQQGAAEDDSETLDCKKKVDIIELRKAYILECIEENDVSIIVKEENILENNTSSCKTENDTSGTSINESNDVNNNNNNDKLDQESDQAVDLETGLGGERTTDAVNNSFVLSCDMTDLNTTEDGSDSFEDDDNGVLVFPQEKRLAPQTQYVSRTCAICLECYKSGEQVAWSCNAQCRHAFHLQCIVSYLGVGVKGKHNFPCPTCRRQDFITSTKQSKDDNVEKK